jgi:hypothetical protein
MAKRSQQRPVSPVSLDPALVVAATQAWLDRVVIGLNLCPFAKAARAARRTRIVCSDAADVETLLAALCAEMQLLATTPPAKLETTLLVHPGVLADFGDYNDFLDIADAALEAVGCSGVLQIASFHPDYRFAGTAADDIGNATNRSPYPVLQLLREQSVSAAAAAFPDGAAIYESNIATLQALGPAGWASLQADCRRDAALAVQSEADPG